MQNQASFSWVLGKSGVAPVKNPKRKKRRKRRFTACRRVKGLKRGQKRRRLSGKASAARSRARAKARRLGVPKYALATCNSASAINALIRKAKKRKLIRKGRKRMVRRRSKRRRNPAAPSAAASRLRQARARAAFGSIDRSMAGPSPRRRMVRSRRARGGDPRTVAELRRILRVAGVPCRSTMKKAGLVRKVRALEAGRSVGRGKAKWGSCKPRKAKRKATKKSGKRKVRRGSKRKGRKFTTCRKSKKRKLNRKQAAARARAVRAARRRGVPLYALRQCRTAAAVNRKARQIARGGGRRRNPMGGFRRNPFRRNPLPLGFGGGQMDSDVEVPIAGRLTLLPVGGGQAFGLTYREIGVAAFGGIAAGFAGNYVREKLQSLIGVGGAFLGPVLQAAGGFWLGQVAQNYGLFRGGEATVFNAVNVAAAFEGLARQATDSFSQMTGVRAFGLGQGIQTMLTDSGQRAYQPGGIAPLGPSTGLGGGLQSRIDRQYHLKGALQAPFQGSRGQVYSGNSGTPATGIAALTSDASGLRGAGPFGLGESMPSDNPACANPVYTGLCYGQSGVSQRTGLHTTPAFMR